MGAVRRPAALLGLGIAAACLLLAGAPARAETYVCTNTAGKRFTGDLPPPECKDTEIRVLNPDGTLLRTIPAPLTREQKRAREAEREAELVKEEAERAQARRDRALLETYGSPDEIDAARSRALAGQQMLVDRADQRIAQYTREKKRLDDEAEFYSKREIPPKLKEAYDANKSLNDQQLKTRSSAIQEMDRINLRFDGEKKRYQELEEMAAKVAAEREREAAESK